MHLNNYIYYLKDHLFIYYKLFHLVEISVK